VVSFAGVHALAASAVGGGSTAYGSILEPPRNPALWQARHPALDPAEIERYYGKVIGDLGGVRVSREQGLPQSVWDHFPDGRSARCRAAAEQPLVAMLMPSTPAQAGQPVASGPAGVQRRYCAFDGDGFLGSPGGAKASVDFVYLASVLGKGATVRDLCGGTHPAGRPGPARATSSNLYSRGVAETVTAPQWSWPRARSIPAVAVRELWWRSRCGARSGPPRRPDRRVDQAVGSGVRPAFGRGPGRARDRRARARAHRRGRPSGVRLAAALRQAVIRGSSACSHGIDSTRAKRDLRRWAVRSTTTIARNRSTTSCARCFVS
jgi:hypothetical protein